MIIFLQGFAQYYNICDRYEIIYDTNTNKFPNIGDHINVLLRKRIVTPFYEFCIFSISFISEEMR